MFTHNPLQEPLLVRISNTTISFLEYYYANKLELLIQDKKNKEKNLDESLKYRYQSLTNSCMYLFCIIRPRIADWLIKQRSSMAGWLGGCVPKRNISARRGGRSPLGPAEKVVDTPPSGIWPSLPNIIYRKNVSSCSWLFFSVAAPLFPLIWLRLHLQPFYVPLKCTSSQ